MLKTWLGDIVHPQNVIDSYRTEGHSYILNNTLRAVKQTYVVTVRSQQGAAAAQNQHTPRKALGNVSCVLALNTF